MLFKQKFLTGIEAGTITLAFRRWQRPTVKAGGTLLTAVGQLSIEAVTPVTLAKITAADAKRAGWESLEALREELERGERGARGDRDGGQIYRIELGELRPDPRVALREKDLDARTADDVQARLDRMDARSATGPWTRRTLEVIRDHPAVRAGDLCGKLGLDMMPFKVNVRKLKALGLTESLGTGYRLSPRGRAYLERRTKTK
jgi:hypothetical protein